MLKVVSNFVNAIGALNYKGTWNASTNNPTLASGVGTKGDYYVVSVAGSTNLDGNTLWGVGDWAVFNGTAWQRVEGGDTGNFTSVMVTGLTASKPVFTDSNKMLTSSGTLGADQGGTGLSTYAIGDLPYASASTTISKLTIGANNTVMTSSGTAPQWSTALTLSGNVSAAALIPSSSSVPSNGMYLAAANTLTFSTNTTERVRISSTGNVGIGTNAPNTSLVVGAPNTQLTAITASISGTTPTLASGQGILEICSTDAAAADTGGGLTFHANTVSLNGYVMAGIAGKSETSAASNYSGYLQFSTTTSAGSHVENMRITSKGNIYGTAGTTNMTDGFFYIPAAAGAPIGTPTSISGRLPMYYDSTNNDFYIYNGVWKKVSLA